MLSHSFDRSASTLNMFPGFVPYTGGQDRTIRILSLDSRATIFIFEIVIYLEIIQNMCWLLYALYLFIKLMKLLSMDFKYNCFQILSAVSRSIVDLRDYRPAQ